MSETKEDFRSLGMLASLRLLAESTTSGFRRKIAGMAGVTHGGKRDLYDVLGYKRVISIEDYRERYKRNPIARRVVNALPDDTWKGVGELIEDEDPEKITPFEQAWFDLEDRLNIWSTFHRADRLAGIGRYAGILIGAPGSLDSELPTLSSDDIFYLRPYAEDDLLIEKYIEDIQNSRWGLPELYTLKADRANIKDSGEDKQVHWSRIVHIADDLLDDDVLAIPRMECVWNDFDNLEKIAGGGSEAFWLRAHQGYMFDVDKEVNLDEPAKQALKEEVQEFLDGMRRAVRTQGMKVTTLGSDVADFNTNIDAILKLISAGSTIPLRILIGSERGELASTSDDDNWNDRVDSRRSAIASPRVIRPFVDRLIERGALPEPVDYDVRWPVREPSPEERANLASKYAEVNQKAGETVITGNEIRDHAFEWEPLDPSEVRIDGQVDEETGGNTSGAETKRPVAAARHRSLKYGTMSDKRRTWWQKRRESREAKLRARS